MSGGTYTELIPRFTTSSVTLFLPKQVVAIYLDVVEGKKSSGNNDYIVYTFFTENLFIYE